MKRIIITLFGLLSASFLFAQTEGISINTTGNDPDSSAMLDVQSTGKGMLIPRMTSAQRAAINNPAIGLMVYDTDTFGFWFYDGSKWVEMLSGLSNPIIDNDGDTRILVEKTTDEDVIRMSAGGVESLQVTNDGIFSAGQADDLGIPAISGPGRRLMWLPGVGAFRVGQAVGTEWDGNLAFNSSVLGGENNLIPNSGQNSSIGGGKNNTVSWSFSFLGGGTSNNIDARYSFIGGGSQNLVSDQFTAVGGGRFNQSNGEFSAVLGGKSNQANGKYSSISGGALNTASGRYSFAGGIGNTAQSYGETVLGTYATAYTPASDTLFANPDRLFVVGNGTSSNNRSEAMTILKNGHTGLGTGAPDTTLHVEGGLKYVDGNQEEGRVLTSDGNGMASWGARLATTQGTDGNIYNIRAARSRTNLIEDPGDPRGEYSVDLQPRRFTSDQVAAGNYATISGGESNTANGAGATVGGGSRNEASGNYSTIDGGVFNTTYGELSTIGGGFLNVASGRMSAIPGGYGLQADSHAETVVGIFNQGSSGSVSNWVGTDPIFVVGNGTDSSARSNAMTVLKNGNVGIGTTNPTKAKLEVSGHEDYLISSGFGYLNSLGQIGYISSPAVGQYSIYASARIAAVGFNSHSDARIKNIHGRSDRKTDLSTLMSIEVTDYQMRDSISKGNRPVKKVIAQQVAEVYPQAVTNNLTEVIPDIYQRAELQDSWIMLATDLQAGERVKLITQDQSEVHEVLEAEAKRFKVSGLASRSEAVSPLASQLFVYGREVNDFHTVDYEAISMLNVSATQAQQRLIEALQAEIQQLRQRNSHLEIQHEGLEARLDLVESYLRQSLQQAAVNRNR